MDNQIQYDIEDASDEFDLDTLLVGMDDVKANGAMKTAIRIADSIKTDNPHIKVELSKLVYAIKAASTVGSGIVGKNLIGQAVGFKADRQKGTLKVFGSDSYVYTSYEIPLFRMGENDEVYEKFFTVSYSVLKKLIKVCEGAVVIYEKDDSLYLKLVEGDIEIILKEQEYGEDIFTCKEKPTKKHKGFQVDIDSLKNVLSKLYPYVCLGTSTAQFRLFVENNTFYSQNMWSCVRVTSPQEMPNMELSTKDIRTICALFNGVQDKQVTIKTTDNRIFFEGGNFYFTTVIVGEKVPREIIEGMDELIFRPEHHPILLPVPILSKIVELSTALEYSISKMQFNFGENNDLYATMLTKGKDSVFRIGSVNDGIKLTPIETPIEVQSKLLNEMLRLFRHLDNVNFYISPHGVGIKSPMTLGEHTLNFESALYTESAISDLTKVQSKSSENSKAE